jgi:hypothetical protein
MNRSDQNRLLDDLFANATPDAFRDALLMDTLHHVRRRRIGRRVRKVLGTASTIAVVAVGWLSFHRSPHAMPGYTLVTTRPMPASEWVATQRFNETLIARVDPVPTIMTSHTVRLIGDAELLALASPRPAALIRIGPATQELVFLQR